MSQRRQNNDIPSQRAPSGPVCDTNQAREVAKKLFGAYDRDQNGIIDQNEVSSMIIDAYKGMGKGFNPTQKDLESFAYVLDINRDGKVTYQDIEQFAMRVLTGAQQSFQQTVVIRSDLSQEAPKYSKATEERLEVARRLFKKFDTDNDGYLLERDVCDKDQ